MKLLPILMLLTLTAGAADYYVATYGDDSGPGTSTNSPWKSLSYATRWRGATLQAGDTLYVLEGTYYGNTNCIDLGTGIGNTGTAVSPITIINYPGMNRPVFTDITNAPNYGAIIKSKSYYVISGIMWSNIVAGPYLNNVTNFIITNCVGTQMRYHTNIDDPNAVSAFMNFTGVSQSNRVVNCLITNWGTTFTNEGTASFYTRGSPIIIGESDLTTNTPCWYNVVEGCTLAHCGHDLLGANSGFCVIRSNLFYNDAWMATNAIAGYLLYGLTPRSEPNPIGKWGARITKTGGGNNDFTDVADGNVGNTVDCRTVFEDNIMLYGSIPVDSNDATLGICTRAGIYRRNIIAFNAGSGIYFEHSGHELRIPTAATNNPAYFHSDTLDTSYGTNCAMSTLNCIYNNVIYGNGMVNRSNWPLHGGAEAWAPVHGIESSANATSPNSEAALINNWVVNNIIWYNSPSNTAPTIDNGFIFSGITWHPAIMRTNWDGDVPGLPDPMFVSTNGMGFVYDAANLPDFHISTNSPCVDAGGWLTTAVGSSNGTVMAVFNSLFFSDGNHMVAGDTIQLQGQTTTVTVVANDWTNNVLTLSAPLTWTDGQGVALAYSGLAPDMGAYETTGFALPRGDLHVINGNIGTFIVR